MFASVYNFETLMGKRRNAPTMYVNNRLCSNRYIHAHTHTTQQSVFDKKKIVYKCIHTINTSYYICMVILY